MSEKHPIVAVTGSSGAGTSTVRLAMEHIFHRDGFSAALVDGDGFHRYDSATMRAMQDQSSASHTVLTHFSPQANLLERLEQLFQEYGASGTGTRRHFVHDEAQAGVLGHPVGAFTPWEPLPAATDLLFYEGMHGGVVTGRTDVARHVDLLIGVTPMVNLEWIQKIHRDTRELGHSIQSVTATILGRMHDYVHYITPQFSRTHINFQRVPLVDTSNPFIARDIPTLDESFVVIRFGEPLKQQMDYTYLLKMLQDSFMSRPNTIVIPGGKLGFAMEIILQPLIEGLVYRGELSWRR